MLNEKKNALKRMLSAAQRYEEKSPKNAAPVFPPLITIPSL